MVLAKEALTKVQAAIIAVIIIVAAIASVAYYLSLPPSAPPTPLALRVATYTGISTVDPAEHLDEASSMVIVNCYDSLFMPKVIEGVEQVIPHLVTDYEFSADGLTCTVHLQKGVEFHDGSELKAEDAAFDF